MKPIANFEQLEYHPVLIDNPVPVEIESVSALTGDHGIGDARGHLVHLITLSGECEGVDIVVIWNRDTIRLRWKNGRAVDFRLPSPYHLESPKRFSTYLGGLLRDFVGQSK